MDQAERAIALLGIRDDDAKRHHVGQLLEADVALGHLAPNRIGMLLAPRHLGLDAVAAEQQHQPRADPRDAIPARPLAQLFEPPGDGFERLGFQLAKGERLHLLHEFVHADTLGERRVDLHRLARNSAALVGIGDVVERPHVVQPVGELDQQHADVVRHGEQELAEIFGGALALGLRLDLAELGDAIDHARNLGAEQPLDLVIGGDGILDRVVQNRGRDRLAVEPQVGEDARHLDRMAEIRVAAGALLTAMRLHREDIGAVEQFLVHVGVVAADPLDELILSQHDAMMWPARLRTQP